MVGLATRLRDTAFKRTLASLEVGDEVQVEEPKGSFVLPEETDVPYVFAAGGIGITVFRSMLRFIADKTLPYDVTLCYSNRDRESAAFLDELEELSSDPGSSVVLTMTEDPGWEGETRRIDPDLLREYVGDLDVPRFFTAGPPAMAEGVADALKAAGVPEDHVVAGKFSGY